MAKSEMLMVFAYDVEDNRTRRRVARVLENHAVRVQKSVFEAWMDQDLAREVSRHAASELGPNDSLRVYAVGEAGYQRTRVFGTTVLSEKQSYYLV